MTYNPLEISAIVAFKSFADLRRHATPRDPWAEYRKKRHEHRIMAHCRGQNVTVQQLPMISLFSDGLVEVLLQTPTTGSQVLDHVTHFDAAVESDITAVLKRKQIDYLHQSHEMLDQMRYYTPLDGQDGLVYLRLERKRQVSAAIFDDTTTRLTGVEWGALHDWAQHVDALKSPPGITLLPTRPPAPPSPPFPRAG